MEAGYHIATYRGMLDAEACNVSGRVLKRSSPAEPGEDDRWWSNLRQSWRRFASRCLPGVSVDISFRGHSASAITDRNGYYRLRIPMSTAPCGELWQDAEVRCGQGGPTFLQPVLCVPASATFGVISDLDDTVLQSHVTDWQTAMQLAFLHNARTRKPLEGVAALYQAFHAGSAGSRLNPIFYVSASPWNLYDLLEDFLDFNDIPKGPMLLRDLRLSPASLGPNRRTLGKLEHVHTLVERYPALQWVLIGDSGQHDAQIYAETVEKYPGRILAVYIRDIDPDSATHRDARVDGHIERLANDVPMLRVTDSDEIAMHARGLGLLADDQLEPIHQDVALDQTRPGPTEATLRKAATGSGTGPATR